MSDKTIEDLAYEAHGASDEQLEAFSAISHTTTT